MVILANFLVLFSSLGPKPLHPYFPLFDFEGLTRMHLTKFELRKSVDLGLSYGLTLATPEVTS